VNRLPGGEVGEIIGAGVIVDVTGGISVGVVVGVVVLALVVSTINCGALAPDSRLAKLMAVVPGTVSARL
jgi:hypothetical protein